MEFELYSKLFTEKGVLNGYSKDKIAEFLAYAEPLMEKNLPVIYDPNHFAELVGYKASYIARAIVFTPFFYRKFRIKKSNGTFRELAEPLPSLKHIQHWILNYILNNVTPSKFAKAYLQNIGIKQNLVYHRDRPIVLKLDIVDFFGSISRLQVHDIFRKQLGYSSALSNLMAKLCCLNETLPQGAPTSPYLSNLFLSEFDNAIGSFCIKRKIYYTRYADDLTFSGDFDPNEMVEKIKQELQSYSLHLNEDKTKLMKQGTRQTVTGIVVNKKLQVSKASRNKIRQEMHYINLFGLNKHIANIKNTKKNYLKHLMGRVQHILFINPADEEFRMYNKRLHELCKMPTSKLE